MRRLVQHKHCSVKLTTKQHIQKKKKKWHLDNTLTQQVKILWIQVVKQEVNTNYMHQDNRVVRAVDISTQTADTKHMGVNGENYNFTIRGLTVKACSQLHACLSKHSSIGPDQLQVCEY